MREVPVFHNYFLTRNVSAMTTLVVIATGENKVQFLVPTNNIDALPDL